MSKNKIKYSSKGTRKERARKGLLISSRIIAAVMSVLFGVMLTGSQIAFANTDTISAFLEQDFVNYVKIESDEDENVDTDYYKSEYASVAEVREAGMAITERVMNEGAVLLKNDDCLPLDTAQDKITMFSVSSAKPIYSGGRENYEKKSSIDADLLSGLKNAGFTVNEDLYNYYKTSSYGRQYTFGEGIYIFPNINEAPWSSLPAAASSKDYNTAMFVLSRIASEGTDATVRNLGEANASDKKNGNYLLLNDVERDVMSHIKQLKDDGTFDNFILLMNTTNQVALDFLDEFGVDAVLYCGSLGSRGANSVGNILAGKVNPSGKLSDTFWKNHYLNPTLTNWGPMDYNGGNGYHDYVGFTYDDNGTHGNYDSYVVYQEGIYEGYRYTETRYEDKVLGTNNVGEFNYYDAVAYPFGFGLSYSEFKYSDMTVDYEEATDEYVVSVKVTNSKGKEGKNAVQLFLQRPYTEYDKSAEHPVEKEAVMLVDFEKTKVLSVGGDEVVTLRVPRRELAAYDSYGHGTYILEEGDYYFTVAQDAHEAVNNILAAKNKTIDDGMDAKGDASLAVVVNDVKADELLKYSTSANGTEIANAFNDVDPKINEKGDTNAGRFDYMTRSNWNGTVKYAFSADGSTFLGNYVHLTKSTKIANSLSSTVQKDDGKYPTYGATAKWQLIDLRLDENGERISYDDPRWDELLDQMTYDEMAELLSNGFAQTKFVLSITKPATYDYDSDLGVINAYSSGNVGLATINNDPDKGLKPAAYPDNGIVGATRNKELLLDYGVQWGEDCLWAGYHGLYGAGINIHRNPYLGRTYGYFSEDPLVGGESVALMNVGMESKGSYMLLKHCMLNEQETNRVGGSSWANEQSIREIYLKTFQYAIERGGVQGVMTSLNRLGTTPAPHHNFLNVVLRGEFGMNGYCVTDSYMGFMEIGACVLAGNDLPLSQDSRIYNYKEGYSKVAWAMRDSVHNILYTVVNSSAMNGLSSDVRIVSFQPEWIYMMNIALPVVTTISLLCIAFFFAMEIWRYFWKPIKQSEYEKDVIVLKGGAIDEYNNEVLARAGVNRTDESKYEKKIAELAAEIDELKKELGKPNNQE